jgi:SAM-dependent methyltransferase
MRELPDHLPTREEKLAIYDRYAEEYARRTEGFSSFLEPDYARFQASLPGPRILDLGCGPGRDAEVFARRGLSPLCLDLSEAMLSLCAAKGLSTRRVDIEQLELAPQSCDGVWSYTSLTTIPKALVWQALAVVQQALAPNGLLFLGLIEGEGEGWKPANEKYDRPRYISRYSHDEVVAELSAFELLHFRNLSAEETGRNSYLNFLFRLRD